MKRLLTLAMMIVACVNCFAGNGFNLECQCVLYAVQPDLKNEDPEPQIPRRRTPVAPLMCTISEERGVEFLSGGNPEILYYEIVENDTTVLSCADEETFVYTLFSLSGEVKIVIATPQWDYIGYVDM